MWKSNVALGIEVHVCIWQNCISQPTIHFLWLEMKSRCTSLNKYIVCHNVHQGYHFLYLYEHFPLCLVHLNITVKAWINRHDCMYKQHLCSTTSPFFFFFFTPEVLELSYTFWVWKYWTRYFCYNWTVNINYCRLNIHIMNRYMKLRLCV